MSRPEETRVAAMDVARAQERADRDATIRKQVWQTEKLVESLGSRVRPEPEDPNEAS
jgi:hypothetical protein